VITAAPRAATHKSAVDIFFMPSLLRYAIKRDGAAGFRNSRGNGSRRHRHGIDFVRDRVLPITFGETPARLRFKPANTIADITTVIGVSAERAYGERNIVIPPGARCEQDSSICRWETDRYWSD